MPRERVHKSRAAGNICAEVRTVAGRSDFHPARLHERARSCNMHSLPKLQVAANNPTDRMLREQMRIF